MVTESCLLQIHVHYGIGTPRKMLMGKKTDKNNDSEQLPIQNQVLDLQLIVLNSK